MQEFRVSVEVFLFRPRAGPRSTAAAVTVALATAALLVVLPAAAGTDRRDGTRGPGRPNIILIVTDDQNLHPLDASVMPNVTSLLSTNGTRFTEAIATTPLCCPSRATMLTGQYAHNHGVTWNTPGYPNLVGKGNTLPVWLRRAGYNTAHVGKYLNGYERFAQPLSEVPPGWDEWHSVFHPTYYDYRLFVNGGSVFHGEREADYITRVLNNRAAALIHSYLPQKKPLYLQVDQFAPHGTPGSGGDPCRGSAIPAPGDEGAFEALPFPQPLSFNEQNVSDKPSFIRRLPRLDSRDVTNLTRKYRCRAESLLAVDRGVDRIFGALHKEGELDQTVVIFTSDNGYFLGEHRIEGGKGQPYEEGIRVPLLMRVPAGVLGRPAAAVVTQPVGNIDLAPTIMRLAGGPPCSSPSTCRVMDGRSLLPLLRGETAGWPADRGLLVEHEVVHEHGPRKGGTCKSEAVRTPDAIALRHLRLPNPTTGVCEPATGVSEYYNLDADPLQLSNIHPTTFGTTDGDRERNLLQRLAVLHDCAGIEGRDPPPPGRDWCE